MLHRQEILTIQPFESPPAAQSPVPVFALIGGVGSGKSAVARELANRRSIVVIDGDAAGHQVLRDPHVQNQIRERFGADVFDPNGTVDRAALGRKVFGDSPERRQALRDLERITHPRIRQAFEHQINAVRSSRSADAIILDAAVLLEAGWHDLCDAVIFVDTPREERQRRVVANRGWSVEQFETRERSQLSLEDKKVRSQHRIDNSGSLLDSSRQLERILDDAVSRRARG